MMQFQMICYDYKNASYETMRCKSLRCLVPRHDRRMFVQSSCHPDEGGISGSYTFRWSVMALGKCIHNETMSCKSLRCLVPRHDRRRCHPDEGEIQGRCTFSVAVIATKEGSQGDAISDDP